MQITEATKKIEGKLPTGYRLDETKFGIAIRNHNGKPFYPDWDMDGEAIAAAARAALRDRTRSDRRARGRAVK